MSVSDIALTDFESVKSDNSSSSSANTIEIPLRGGDEVIELDINQLPDGDEVINILTQEVAPLPVWINIALAYYKKKLFDDFEKVLEEAKQSVSNLQPYSENDFLQLLDMLANYCGKKASRQVRIYVFFTENNKEKRTQLITRAATLFTSADRIAMYDQKHLLGRAFYFIYEGEKWSQADSQLNFVLNQGSPNVQAYLGKACIAFNKQEYRNALAFYRKALRLQPNCSASVRLGIGHCFARLGNPQKARLAFQRALDLDPESVEALVGLAILDLNEKTQESIKQGVQKLSKAYNLGPTNPMVLNHLADHFFYKKEYDKVHQLAMHAFHNTENEAMRAESCYQMARALHVEGNYDKAFQYYYLATQFASPNFLLPFYGLGQMYLHRNDLEHAAIAFEKVLKVYPNNYETLKILGSLYAQSNKLDKRAQAKQLFKQVTESQPDDVEAWIEYAQLLENDTSGALSAYLNALSILENVQLEVSPEILNNIGVLYFMNNEHSKAGSFLNRAYDRIREEQLQEEESGGIDGEGRASHLQYPAPLTSTTTANAILELHRRTATTSGDTASASAGGGDNYYHDLAVTVHYNQARLHEAMNRPDLAEAAYKSILLQHPTYADCYIRLGCIASDRGQLRDASLWFREVLEVNPDHPDAWSLLGQLHLSRGEVESAQRKFERIIRQPKYRADAYCRITLGNVWLRSLHHHHRYNTNPNQTQQQQQQGRDKDRRRRHEERALSCYKAVLSADPRNIWAAHGIGCVLAHKGFINEARDVFAQVREATADFPDVWMNIAHVYVEQKQYTAAIQMYENCIRKFNKSSDTELLLYLARAYFKANHLKECKAVLLKARHVKPWDPLLTFNLALVQKRMAVLVLKDEASSFAAVCEAISDLSMARCTFEHISKSSEIVNQSISLDEARACHDLLSQAKYHLDRAKSREEQERLFRQRQEEEREAQRRKQAELQAKAEALRLERERRLEEERGKFIEKAKQISLESSALEKKVRKSTGGKKRAADEDGFIDDGVDSSSSSGNDVDREKAVGEAGDIILKKSVRRLKKSLRGAVETKRRKTSPSKELSERHNHHYHHHHRHHQHHHHRSNDEEKLSTRQRGRVVSKALISDEDDFGSSSGDEDMEEARIRHQKKVEAQEVEGAERSLSHQGKRKDALDSLSESSDDKLVLRKGSDRAEKVESRRSVERGRKRKSSDDESSDNEGGGGGAAKRARVLESSSSGSEAGDTQERQEEKTLLAKNVASWLRTLSSSSEDES
uniref:RNA polymerase associated protein CTR9 n=1 Tax=Echinococcus granulosus TaxID=6210 RepID=A0A068WTZ3_ECHGR|nr:RNA polymerase associated protein CTR9 [Echinococcus granulosus]